MLGVDGVEEVHELHIWQLSESKLIASLHVRTTQNCDFMQVAAEIKRRLHDRGIHSVTIQPEYDPSIDAPSFSSGRVGLTSSIAFFLLTISFLGLSGESLSAHMPT